MKKDYELLSFVQGKRRKAVLLSLEKNAKIPKQIATELKISISNVSNTLAELIEKELIFCNNPQSHIYKYYELTKKGKEILKELDRQTKI
jgi:DNA-binding MarR family transcriptional regulator